MTNERKKAILTLTSTLIIGILLGMLVPGLFHKVRSHRGIGDRAIKPQQKREWFTGTIYKIIQPDSNQAKQIRPVAEWASIKIDSIEASSNQGLANVLDSVKKQIKPMITEEQFVRLEAFDAKAKGHWRGRGRN